MKATSEVGPGAVDTSSEETPGQVPRAALWTWEELRSRRRTHLTSDNSAVTGQFYYSRMKKLQRKKDGFNIRYN